MDRGSVRVGGTMPHQQGGRVGTAREGDGEVDWPPPLKAIHLYSCVAVQKETLTVGSRRQKRLTPSCNDALFLPDGAPPHRRIDPQPRGHSLSSTGSTLRRCRLGWRPTKDLTTLAPTPKTLAPTPRTAGSPRSRPRSPPRSADSPARRRPGHPPHRQPRQHPRAPPPRLRDRLPRRRRFILLCRELPG